MRIGRFGPYVQLGEGDEAKTASIPDDTPPADLTLERAVELVEARAKGPDQLGTDPATGLPIYLMTGRFGPYVQLGETPERGSTEKPRRASLTRDDDPATITEERALAAARAAAARRPRSGQSGEEIVSNFGRYGPYVKRGDDFRSLSSDAEVFSVTLDEAVELFRQEKPSRRGGSRTGAPRARRAPGVRRAPSACSRADTARTSPTARRTPRCRRTWPADAVTLDAAVGLLKAREGAKPRGRGRSDEAIRIGTAKHEAHGRRRAR